MGGELGFTGTVMRFSLKRKCNTEAVKHFSLIKSATLAFIISFLVINFDDEYDEENTTKKTMTTTTRTTMKTTATTTATTTTKKAATTTRTTTDESHYFLPHRR